MAAALTDTTLVMVGAGHAFDRRRRSDRYMCHRKSGFAFRCGFIGLECASKWGYAVFVAPYDAGGVVAGVSCGHVASVFSPVKCPALSYFIHLILLTV